jgi:inner membrane protein
VDNVTHTLVGALLAETAALRLRADRLPASSRRGALLFLLIGGSNVPDLDFLYARITPGKLGYLLHHRGHTHTIVGAVAGAALLLGLVVLWWRRRGIRAGRADWRWLVAAALVGPLLHLAMDATNDYGVHPFWPLDDHWYYGDSVFILEPLMWATAGPLLFVERFAPARALVALTLATALVLSWTVGIVLPLDAAVVTAVIAGMLVVGWRCSPRTSLHAGVALWLAVTAMFLVAGRVARSRLDALIASRWPAAAVLDRVTTPLPANPLCWMVTVAAVEDDRYVVRRALLSLWPAVVPAAACPRRGNEEATAPLAPVADAGVPELDWRGELRLGRAELVQLGARHCGVAAFLRFARVPYFTHRDGALVVGDLRYDREPDLGFAELELEDEPASCPRRVPPWIPPRADLLSGP